jgi:hypothetical protein
MPKFIDFHDDDFIITGWLNFEASLSTTFAELPQMRVLRVNKLSKGFDNL